MRLRYKPWAQDKLKEHATIVIEEPEAKKGNWASCFPNKNPIHIEIGTGKGQFITEMAKQNPNINFIGLEKQDRVLVSALDKILSEQHLTNVKLLNANADYLLAYFSKQEVNRIYLNFSDPWPKNRHEKRRLTYEKYLKLYEAILVKDGEIHFKTDNRKLFEYSLESFSAYGMRLKNISLHLHADDDGKNIMTEYEEKFSRKGNRIYRCEARFQ
ncbi:tRNA (guanosine(46)-N7)-methyltransferase TrmB [Pueribacillus sp. YX66]|uniref:tRNA (guanosine(46)-N7)-methyltransferase TrmB n=1 Tax=Pueribacillus sp. YX66 TaxID=3229242 RepID=UPI00358D26B2